MAGTPEIPHLNVIRGRTGRDYDVPGPTSGSLGGARTFDALSGYESAATPQSTVLAGATCARPAAGRNEPGMHCSMARFVVDAEPCAMARELARGTSWGDFEEALTTSDDVDPGGYFLATAYTQEPSQRAFLIRQRCDNNNVEQGSAEGGKEITQRALDYCRAQLRADGQPGLDAGVDAALRDYIARREQALHPDEV